MAGMTLAAVASVAVGLSIGAAATVGVTLAAADDHSVAPASAVPTPSSPYQVQYGDRCNRGNCPPCNSGQACAATFSQAFAP